MKSVLEIGEGMKKVFSKVKNPSLVHWDWKKEKMKYGFQKHILHQQSIASLLYTKLINENV